MKKPPASVSSAERLEPLPRSYFALQNPYAAPFGDTEQRLARIWQEALGIDGLGAEDDFFLIGGDSYVAVILLEEIEQDFGLTLPLSILVDFPTVRGQARHLEKVLTRISLFYATPASQSSPADEDECLAPIRAGGGAPAIFVAHGLQCDPTFAFHLSAHLPRDQPIFGFRGLGLNGRSKPLATIEGIAARYIESMRRIEPRGPYTLLGFCAGGHVAMEMARQLALAGERVAHLFLIDTPLTVDPAFIDKEIKIAKRTLKMGPLVRKHLAGGPAAVAAFGQALKGYRPKLCSSPVHILASRTTVAGMRDPQRGWPKYLPPGTSIDVVALTHESIVNQGMPVIAGYIDQRLRRRSGSDAPAYGPRLPTTD